MHLVLGYPLVAKPLFLGTDIAFLFGSFCVLRAWLGFLPAWDLQVVNSYVHTLLNCHIGVPKIWLDRSVGCTPFVVTVLPTVASSQGNCRSLSFGYFGEWLWILVSSVFCILLGDASFVIQCFHEYLLFVLAKT